MGSLVKIDAWKAQKLQALDDEVRAFEELDKKISCDIVNAYADIVQTVLVEMEAKPDDEMMRELEEFMVAPWRKCSELFQNFEKHYVVAFQAGPSADLEALKAGISLVYILCAGLGRGCPALARRPPGAALAGAHLQWC